MLEVYVCQRGNLFGIYRHAYNALWDSAWHEGVSVKLFRVLIKLEKISKWHPA